MAESFVKTFKRDYVSINPTPDALTVLEQFADLVRRLQRGPSAYGLSYRSPNEFRDDKLSPNPCPGL
jgi:putative transposase